MADVIAEFIAALTFKADTREVTEAEKTAKEAAERSAAAWQKFGGVIAGVGKAALGAAGGLLALVERSAASAANIDDMSRRLGIGTTELQRLSFAATQAGSGPEALGTAIKVLNKQIDDARKGTGPAAEAFAKLGISIESLNGKSAEQQLGILADGISQVDDPATRTALALDLLGRGGLELLPALADGAAGLKAMGDEAERSGLVLREDAIAAAAEFDDQVGKLKMQVVAFARDIGIELIPVVQKLAENWRDFLPAVGALGVAFVGLKLGAVATGLTSVGLAAAGSVAGVAGLVAVVGGLGFALGSVLDTALGLSDALAGLSNRGTSGTRGAPALLGAEDSARRNELTARRAGILDGSITDTGIDPVGQIDRELAALEAKGRARAAASKKTTADATELAANTVGRTAAESAAIADRAKKRNAQAQLDSGAKFRKKRGGGKGSGFAEDIGAGEFEFDDQYGDELRRLADRFGVGPAAVDAAIKAGASSVASGDTPFIARNAALSRLGSSAGVDLTVKKQTDPLLSQIFGDENVPDVALSSIARGAEPQVLISNITNTFNFDIAQSIDGAGDPATVGDLSGRAIRDYFQGSIAAATRTAKVNFAR
jgi:hypothetical protein